MTAIVRPVPLFVPKTTLEETLQEVGITPLPYGKVVAHKRQALRQSRCHVHPFWGQFGSLFRFLYVGLLVLFFGSIVTAVLSGGVTVPLVALAALERAPWKYALLTGATAIIPALISWILFLSKDHNPIALILDIGQLQWRREPWTKYDYRENSVPEEVRTTIGAVEKAGYPVAIESFCYDPFAVVGRWPRKTYIACWNCPGFDSP